MGCFGRVVVVVVVVADDDDGSDCSLLFPSSPPPEAPNCVFPKCCCWFGLGLDVGGSELVHLSSLSGDSGPNV